MRLLDIQFEKMRKLKQQKIIHKIIVSVCSFEYTREMYACLIHIIFERVHIYIYTRRKKKTRIWHHWTSESEREKIAIRR